MLKKSLLLALAISLLHLGAPPVLAFSQDEKESRRIAKVKSEVSKRGVGEKARIRVKLRNDTEVRGYVSRARKLARKALVGGLCLVFGLSVIQARQRGLWEEDARRYHASEDALARLVDVAELFTGITDLNFVIHPQLGCTESYGSSVCPVPGKNRLQAILAAGRNDIALEIKRLWAVADRDDSMFVTDEEGQRFRILVNFGLMLEFLANRTRSVARLAPLMRLEPEQFRTRLREYEDLVAWARKFGVSLVSTPSDGLK